MKADRGSRGIAPLTLDLNFALRPFYPRERPPATIQYDEGEASGFGEEKNLLIPAGIRTLDPPARNVVTIPASPP
jgi:hypothetical protein